MAPDWDTSEAGPVSARSFVVRVLRDGDAGDAGGSRWRGSVVDTATGERQVWRRPSDVARFIDWCLGERTARIEGAAMAGPALTDVVNDMLGELGARLPLAAPSLPDSNVTLERIREKLVGLGNQRGTEPTHVLGMRTLRGGRIDARVRFQLWGVTAPAVDTAVTVLQADLLDDRDVLRQAGFLRFAAVETTLAERVESVAGWRKTTSYDVLYEYSYVDTDDADSLIVAIPVTLDPEQAGSPDRETQTLTDGMVRWDDEGAPALRIRGPATVGRLSALVFTPGPVPGGTVVVTRSSAAAGPVTHLPDLPGFLDATGGSSPAATDADVTVTFADFFAGIGLSGDTLDLGDWNTDGTTDSYTGYDRCLDRPIVLAGPDDRLTVTYTASPGPSTGLDQTAVAYLRVNAP
ncbi:hypothetical protein [Actinopolymorpha alba]|uniref:hypothetical protein n=1 Tax=Actinopolymorpha alba TaxID=533267 RepID=UPI00037CA6A8|nr:hypothetical protein [Actinopolymorpha alba]